jgi:hypothetical protein
VQVRCDEGVAIHIGPKPCVCACEGAGEASVGERIGQPLSRESHYPGRRRFNPDGRRHGGTRQRECSDSSRGRRLWHVRKLCVREPGDLSPIRGACVAGSRREGEEP